MTKNGTSTDQRSVILIPFPYSDLSASKKRPSLILSKTDFNKRNKDVVCCMITSRLEVTESDVELTDNDIETYSSSYLVSGIIKPYRLFTISKSKILKTLGKVKIERYREMEEKVCNLIKS